MRRFYAYFEGHVLVHAAYNEVGGNGYDKVGRSVVVAVEVAVLIVDVNIEGIVEVLALDEYHLSNGGIGKGGVCLFRIGQSHAFDYRLAARVLVVGT